MIIIKLTEKQANILQEHWYRNLEYGIYGTFGDGKNYDSVGEYKIAKTINKKINKAISEGDLR